MKYNVVELFVFIVKRWWQVLITLAIFAAIGVGLAFLLPKRYQTELKLLPTTQEAGLSGALSSITSQLGISGLSIPGSGENAMMLTYGDIIRSKTVTDYVIDSTNLIKRMGFEDRAEASSFLAGATSFTLLSVEQIFVIKVVAPDPKLTADITNAYAKALDYYLTSSSTTRGRYMREFVESRKLKVEAELKAAQDSLTAFQKKHRLPPIDPKTGANIQAYAELQSQALQKELEMEYMRAFSTTQNPQYSVTRRELAFIQAKLSTLPPLATRYAELYRNYMVQEQIYMLLIQQYEQAKLLEAKDTPLISVLEWVKPPKEPFFPPKKLVILALLLIGLVLIFTYAMIKVYWEHVIANPDEHEKMSYLRQEIRNTFSRKNR